MARPKAKEAKKQYTVMLKPSVVEEIDRLADKLELSRSQFMSNLIEMGIDDAKGLEKLKVLDLVTFSGKIGSRLRIGYLKNLFKDEGKPE